MSILHQLFNRYVLLVGIVLAFSAMLWPAAVNAMPVFARQYELSCNTCHSAYPRLNAFGEQFRDNNFRLPNWREKNTVNTGDDMLALPKTVPLAIRAQAFVQGRQAREIDTSDPTDPTTYYWRFTDNSAKADIQAPYLIKLLSSAPLSDHITYYFYGIFAEKGTNGTAVIEDAWFRHDDAFGSGISTMLGQFQVSDLMFPRETRLTFQDFMAYRFSNITYQRGILFERAFGPVKISLGAANGNGTESNYNLNSPGYLRPDKMFDNDTRKNAFGRLGITLAGVSVGVFGMSNRQMSADDTVPNTYGTLAGNRLTRACVEGVDVAGRIGEKLHWYAQGLWNQWDGFLDSNPAIEYSWFAGFAGIDYVHNDRWTYSLLWNYADARQLTNSGTVYAGINMNTLTLAVSYYFMRNLKGVIELNGDFLRDNPNPPLINHATKEGYVLIGIDTAF